MERKQAAVRDVARAMAEIAPAHLAESWDNVGLQVGDGRWIVRRVRVALDPLPEVVEQACDDGVDMLVTHHPLIFRPLKSLDFSTPAGRIVRMALEHRLAVFSAHTNLDSARGGINDYLCGVLGLKNTRPLAPAQEQARCKVVVFVPTKHQARVLDTLCSSGAGRIGAYDCCSFRCEGRGAFRPGPDADPYLGERGEATEMDEVRIEAVVAQRDVERILKALNSVHPYETPACDVYRLEPAGSDVGLGRVGELETPEPLESFASRAKSALGLSSVAIVGEASMAVETAAVCSGSGSGLMKEFFASGADVYISGDLHYHDARDAETRKKGLMDIGHFGSERVVADFLVDSLGAAMEKMGLDVVVDACRMERDPFRIV